MGSELSRVSDGGDVLGVGGCGVDAVFLDGAGGVAEGLSDDRDGPEFGELVEGAEPGRSSAEDVLEPGGDVAGVEWPPG